MEEKEKVIAPLTEISAGTIARTLCLVLALVNQIAVQFGFNPISVEDGSIYELVSVVATVGAAFWAWWKNNSFTKKAVEADKILHQ